jgi:hypothetical protein
MFTLKRTSWIALPGLSLLFGMACSSSTDSPSWHKVSGERQESGDLESQRLHSLQMVRVLVTDPANPNDPPKIETRDPLDVEQDFHYECFREINGTTAMLADPATDPPIGLCPTFHSESNACQDAVCESVLEQCAAHLALEVVALRAAPIVVDYVITDHGEVHEAHYSIPPQSAATNAALAARAASKARESMYWAGQALGQMTQVIPLPTSFQACDADVMSTPTINPVTKVADNRTWGSIAANALVESYQLHREGTFKSVDATLAVADAQRVGGSLVDDVSRSMAGPALSRVAAAHALVGGRKGLQGSTGAESRPGLCSAPELSAQARRAISVLREAAVSPAAILAIPGQVTSGAVAMGVLLDDTGSLVPGGSVRQRLSELWGFDFAHPPSGVNPASSLPEYLHLTEQDFVDARGYLAQEITAFSRSLTAQLDPVDLSKATPSGACGTSGSPALCKRFAATALEPPLRPPAYYGALVRHNGARPGPTDAPHQQALRDMVEMGDGILLESGLPQAERDTMSPFDALPYVDTIDAMQSFAAAFIANEGTITDVNLRASIMNPMGILVNGDERIGRFTFCESHGPAATTISTSVDGMDVNDNIRVILGEDGLSCATTGSIEGERCEDPQNPGQIDPKWIFASLSNSKTPALGFSKATAGSASHEPPNASRIYLVRRRAGVTVDAPGAFEPLAGMTFLFHDFLQPRCVEIPIVPDAEHRAAQIMEPSAKWCSGSRVSCANMDFDSRMPLEDELSADQDGVESSWKHYLALAKQAADEADQLGKAYLQSGLDLDLRQETVELRDEERERIATDRAIAAIDEVQNICGTAVDPIRLLKLLKNGTDEGDLKFVRSDSTCNTDDQCNTAGEPKKFVCLLGDKTSATPSGHCVANLKLLIDSFKNNIDSTIRPDLERLQKCLDTSADDFVHLGSPKRNICIWHDPGNKRRICVGHSKDRPCPIFAADDGSCNTLNNPAGTTIATVTVGLDLINTDDFDNTTIANVGMTKCDAIRAKRRGAPIGNSRIEEGKLIQSGEGLDLDKARAISQKIGFEASYNGYAAITVGNVPFYTTGGPFEGPSNNGKWPCSETTMRKGCSTAGPGSGLFCDADECSDVHKRARLNNRMLGAVMALRAATLPDEALSGDLHAAGTVVYPKVVPQQICVGGQCNDLDFGERSGPHTLKIGTGLPIDVFTGLKVRQRVYLPPAGSPAAARLAYSVPSATGGFFDLDTNDLSGVPVPAQYGGQKFVAFGDVAAYIRAQQASGYSVLKPEFLWSCLQKGPNCGKLDNHQAGANLCTVAPPKCHEETHMSKGHKVTTTVCVPAPKGACNSGYFFSALHQGTDPNKPPPLDAELRLFGAVGDSSWAAGDPAVDADTTAPFNVKFDKSTMLDGLELLCDVEEAGITSDPENTLTPCGPTPTVRTIENLPEAISFAQCAAREVRKAAGRTVLAEFPREALDPLRRESAQGAFPDVGGESGANISELRSALIDLAQVPPLVAEEVKSMGDHMEAVLIAAKEQKIHDQLAKVQLGSQIGERLAACAVAKSPSFSVGVSGGTTGWSVSASVSFNPGAAIATCANSAAQIQFAQEINKLTNELDDLSLRSALNQFSQQFSDSATRLSGYALRLTNAVETVDRQLALIENRRGRAKVALARALYVDSFESKFQAKINAVLWRRFQSDKNRYENALTTAKKMAFLAKRAIEIRLGMKLSEMTAELPLVGAPSTWEASVCTNSGIDFEKLSTPDSGGTPAVDSEFADPFIGDYVRKLEGVVESYRLINSFHEGTDTAVISLRDDVQNVRALCDADVNNHLYYAGELDRPPSDTISGWEHVGCRTTTGENPQPLPNCITVLAEATPPLVQGLADVSSGAKAYHVQFGDASGCAPATCGFTSDSALVQKVAVAPGVYRASIYVNDPGGKDVAEFTQDKGLVVRVSAGSQGASPADIAAVQDTTVVPATQNVSWARVYKVVTVLKPLTLEIGFKQPTDKDGQPLANVVISAPMLESVNSVDTSNLEPAVFANTTDVLTRALPECEDTDGKVFRRQGWRRGTARLCSDGFSGHCAGEDAQEFGFSETSFSLNQRDIEAGKMLGHAGFARGNFNYRIESVGINFVGTGIRDCSTSTLPSTCYSAGFVPFTLTHDGPYFVRNHIGKDFKAELFPGRIENARGLSTERYITNPISSADQQLLGEYMRTELQGRPMDGNFVLRVWDADGLNFDAIQDVQIVLKYRYWTRFQ